MVNILGKICYLQEKALLSLVTELLVISRGTGESEESIINKQTALYSLKLLSRLLCKDYPSEFKEVRRFVVQLSVCTLLSDQMKVIQVKTVTQLLVCSYRHQRALSRCKKRAKFQIYFSRT